MLLHWGLIDIPRVNARVMAGRVVFAGVIRSVVDPFRPQECEQLLGTSTAKPVEEHVH